MPSHACTKLAGAALLALFFLASFAGASRPKSTFRVYVEMSDAAAVGAQNMPVMLYDPPRRIMVRAQPELTEYNIDNIETHPADPGLAMRITLDSHGATVFNSVTLQNQGKILVVMLNGRVVYAPIIDKIIADGVLVIPRGVAADEIAPLKEAIKYARR